MCRLLTVVAPLVAEHRFHVACGLSRCGSGALERRLYTCGTRAQVLRGFWDLPGSGIKPMSPALAGEFFTTEPAGKSKNSSISFQHTPKVASVLCRGLCVYVFIVVQSCPTLCDPMDCSTPGLLVHHQLPELAQTHVH